MKREDFLEELLANCESEYKFFVSFQEMILEIFDVLHSVLEKHGITYYVTKGALIGLIRDGGLIPWDPDFDVMISIDDAAKANQILETELPDGYYVVSNFNNPKFPYYQTRVCKQGYDDRLHVDVFYYFGLPDNAQEVEKIKRNSRKLFKQRQMLLIKLPVTTDRKRNIYYKLLKIQFRLTHLFITRRAIDRKIEKIIHAVPLGRAKRVAAFLENISSIDKSDLGTPTVLELGAHNFCVPSNPEGVLNEFYKDYRAYSPLESRILEYRNGLEDMKEIEGKQKATIDDYRKK